MRTLRNIGAVTLGVFFALLLLEIVLRIADPTVYDRFHNDGVTGLLTYKKNIIFPEFGSCYENTVRTNNIGFHGPDVSQEKKRATYRIAVLGSSFVESLQVPVSEMFTTLLEDKLNQKSDMGSVEVIPIGFSGNTTLLDILYYRQFVRPLKPDLVIVFLTEYEAQHEPSDAILGADGEVHSSLLSSGHGETATLFKNLIRRSHVLMVLLERYHEMVASSKNLFHRAKPSTASTKDTTDPSNEMWNREEMILNSLKQTIASDGAKILFVSWGSAYAATSSKVALVDNLTRIAGEQKIPYIALDKPIAALEKEEGRSGTWSCDGHFNEDGHRFVAEILYRYLVTHQFNFYKY